MESTIDAITLSIVLRYLNNYELDNAAKVSRLWRKIAKNEENLRGPSYNEYIRRIEEKHKSWYSIKADIINNNGARSGLQLFFTDDKKVKSCTEGCHCKNLPPSSYSVVLECHVTMNAETANTVLMSLFFPKTSKTKIATYTFIRDTFKEGLFCPEINFHCGTDIGKVKFLQAHMQTYFENDNSPTSCMLLFCNNSSTDFLIDLLIVLSKWFPKVKICIWGGVVDSISVCQYRYQNNFCSSDAYCILIFINNARIASYVENLDYNCNTPQKIKEKYINLKKRLSLRKHTIALINTNYIRMSNFYSMERYLFKQIFPNIQLFHIVGSAVFNGQGLQSITNNTPVEDPDNVLIHLESSIMIITYD